MTTYNNKVLLLIGGTRLITEAVVRHFLEQGVGQVRAYSGDEEGLTALRDRLGGRCRSCCPCEILRW